MGLGGDEVIMTEASEPINDSENGGQKVYDDESEIVTYNYRSVIHMSHNDDVILFLVFSTLCFQLRHST